MTTEVQARCNVRNITDPEVISGMRDFQTVNILNIIAVIRMQVVNTVGKYFGF